MKKEDFLKKLIQKVTENLESLTQSALEAKAAATDEEAKPEYKYDTRALESSYLAEAQSVRVGELKRALHGLQNFQMKNFKPGQKIEVGALIEVDVEGLGTRRWFFLPFAGGEKVENVFVVTPEAPLGKKLLGLSEGDFFDHNLQGQMRECEITKVF